MNLRIIYEYDTKKLASSRVLNQPSIAGSFLFYVKKQQPTPCYRGNQGLLTWSRVVGALSSTVGKGNRESEAADQFQSPRTIVSIYRHTTTFRNYKYCCCPDNTAINLRCWAATQQGSQSFTVPNSTTPTSTAVLHC